MSRLVVEGTAGQGARSLPAGVFDQSDLSLIDLSDNDLASFRDGVFDSLTSPIQQATRHRAERPDTDSSQSAIGTTILGGVEIRKGMLVLSVYSRERAERRRFHAGAAMRPRIARDDDTAWLIALLLA